MRPQTFVTIMNKTAIILARKVSSKILVLRNQKVILDTELAELYGVPVKRLNEQIKRNRLRFPADFLFTLTRAEYEHLRSQNATSKSERGGRRYLPHAFTEHGAIMAATVLNSKRAIEMSVFVVRAFVQMRQAVVVNQHVVSKLSELENRLDNHDADIQELVEAIRELIAPLPANHRRIGFALPSSTSGQETKQRKSKKA
jgi:ORF6N domain